MLKNTRDTPVCALDVMICNIEMNITIINEYTLTIHYNEGNNIHSMSCSNKYSCDVIMKM